MSNSSSLIFKKVIADRLWSQITKLWLAMSEEDENILITESSLFKLVFDDRKVNLSKQLDTESFLLLITPKVNAFISREVAHVPRKCEIVLAFDRVTITQELLKLSQLRNWENAVVDYWQETIVERLIHSQNNFSKFMLKTIELLINESEKADNSYKPNYTPPMDKLLHYQVEQEHIFEQIKIQISQNINLATIIQAAIERSRIFLGLDRLLIYQLDVAVQSGIAPQAPAKYIDTVTYEALSSQNIDSTLYFQDESWRDLLQGKNKYHQGFNLAISDVDVAHLHPCLQSVMARMKVKAKIVCPIVVMDKLWGFAIAHQCSRTRQWQDREIQFLRQVASYLAIAIHHHRSYQQLQKQKLLLEKQVQTQAQQIKDALIAAEAASKSKHEFLGSMSHELRTPLTCVIGLSSTLLQWSSAKNKGQLSPEKQQEYLYLIQQNGKHLLSLINNILEFSEVESGKHLLNVQQISLTSVAKQSLQILKEIAAAKEIALIPDIKLNIDQDSFFADELRLKEILFNLLSNGIKFTPARGEVTLRVWREKRQVVMQVEDTGIGITEQEMPLLFEKFKQLEDFRQRTQGGTGLGLALTKKLVELHGGTIEVESVSGQGSLFTVYLPEKTPFKPNIKAHTSLIRQNSLSSQTIMLVTEDEEHAIFICQLFNTIECQVVWLMDSSMAINQIELLKPTTIIVDRDYPEAEIKNMARAISEKPLANNANLILLSERPLEDEWQQFADCGVDNYLLKSMNPAQIIDKMKKIIQQD